VWDVRYLMAHVLGVWQHAAVHHCAEKFVHYSCAVIAAVAEAWEHETRRMKLSDHAYFGLYNQKKMGWSKVHFFQGASSCSWQRRSCFTS